MNRPSDACGKLYGRIALQPVGTAALARKIGQETILFCRERLIFPVKKVRQISLCPQWKHCDSCQQAAKRFVRQPPIGMEKQPLGCQQAMKSCVRQLFFKNFVHATRFC